MNKLTLILASIAFLNSANAQSFNLGLRAGTSKYYTEMNNQDKQYYSLNKELASRYQSKKGIAYEISLSHFSWSDGYGLTNHGFSGQDNAGGYTYKDTWLLETNNHFTLNTSLQYDLICPKMKNNCHAMKRVSNYMGISLGITRVYTKQTVQYTILETGNVREKRNYNNNTTLLFGINNTFVYKLNKSISATATVSTMSNYSPIFMFTNGKPYEDKYYWNLNTIMSLGIQYKL